MIITRQRSGKLAIKQEDHAAFAGFILRNWSAHSFPNHPDRDRIIRATCEHDCGWQKFDSSPRLDKKTHLPVDFMQITAEEAHDIWTRATKRFIKTEPFIALLITHHAYTIHEHASRRDPAWRKFFIEFAQQRAALRDQLGFTHNDVEHPYSFIRMADWFSLSFCMHPSLGADKLERYAGYSYKREGNSFLIRPYPLTERGLGYRLPVFPMKQGGYATEREMRAALKEPVYQEITFGPLERWD